MFTEADTELSLTESRGQTRRAVIGQRRRRRRDVTGRQYGDKSRLPVEMMKSITDINDTNMSRQGALNPRIPLPGIHNQLGMHWAWLNYVHVEYSQ